MKVLRLLLRPLRGLISFDPEYHSCRSFISCHAYEHLLGILCTSFPRPGPFLHRRPNSDSFSAWNKGALPGSWTISIPHLPCSPTPARPFLQTLRSHSSVPDKPTSRTLSHKSFGAQSHGFCSRCLRFALRSPSCARLASDFPSRFIGWDFHPQDCSREFQTFTVILTLQVYPGAMVFLFLLFLAS